MTSENRALKETSIAQGSQTRLAQPTRDIQYSRSASAKHRMQNFDKEVLHLTKPNGSSGCHQEAPVWRKSPSQKHSLPRHASAHTPSARCAFSKRYATTSSMGRCGNSHKQRHPSSPWAFRRICMVRTCRCRRDLERRMARRYNGNSAGLACHYRQNC